MNFTSIEKSERTLQVLEVVEKFGFQEVLVEMQAIAVERAADYRTSGSTSWVVATWVRSYERAGNMLKELLNGFV